MRKTSLKDTKKKTIELKLNTSKSDGYPSMITYRSANLSMVPQHNLIDKNDTASNFADAHNQPVKFTKPSTVENTGLDPWTKDMKRMKTS
jgi:hypothetical protein